MIALIRILVVYCALTDLAAAPDRAGQMQELHVQLVRAARES